MKFGRIKDLIEEENKYSQNKNFYLYGMGTLVAIIESSLVWDTIKKASGFLSIF